MGSTPDEISVQDKVKSMNEDCAYIQKKWETSEHHKDLLGFLSFIEEDVLPGSNILIENALCLGLGSLKSVMGSQYGTEAAGPRGQFFIKNFGFLQLIFFETTINALRKSFKVEKVAFQDPSFTAADSAFLEQRGHTVIPYLVNERDVGKSYYGLPLDPVIPQQFSNTTFLFAPSLPLTVLGQAVQALRPFFYLGTDFSVFKTSTYLMNPGGPNGAYLDELEALLWSHDFALMPVLDSDIGFHWPSDPDDDFLRDSVYERLMRHSAESGSMAYTGFEQRYKLEKAMRRAAKPEDALKLLESKVKRLRLDDGYRTYWRTRIEKSETEKVDGEAKEK